MGNMSDAVDRKPNTRSETQPTRGPAAGAGSTGDAAAGSTRERSAPPEGDAPLARSPVTPIAAGATEGKAADVVILGPPTADGQGVHVLRARNERLEAGELRALREGQPVTGEVLSLAPREDMPRVCDVKESWSPPHASRAPSPAAPHKGPAQVATAAYRDGWDQIFGARPKTTQAKDLN